MAIGVDAETAIREYLLFLENPDQLVDHEAIDELKRTVSQATDPIERLKAIARLEAVERPSESTYRAAFIAHARQWADDNDVPASAFVAMGVDEEVLEAARVMPRSAGKSPARRSSAGSGSRSAAGRSSARSTDVRDAALRLEGEFTFNDVAAESGASAMTVRKVVLDLVEAGDVERLGPAPEWTQPGRAPILFRRRS